MGNESVIPSHYLNAVVTGDARVLAEALPDNSVDIIVCDPPYLRADIEHGIYLWLAQAAIRVLKSGGYVFAYSSGEYLLETGDQLRAGGLTYFWLDVLLHNGGYPRVWYKQLMSGYKPIFVFTKDKPKKLAWQSTVCTVSADKRYHEWGQGTGFALKIIELLTQPGDVIFDPFCGGGTVPAVCKMLGRQYIAFEIDPTTADNARQRVLNTQPPLPLVYDNQLELSLDT